MRHLKLRLSAYKIVIISIKIAFLRKFIELIGAKSPIRITEIKGGTVFFCPLVVKILWIVADEMPTCEATHRATLEQLPVVFDFRRN